MNLAFVLLLSVCCVALLYVLIAVQRKGTQRTLRATTNTTQKLIQKKSYNYKLLSALRGPLCTLCSISLHRKKWNQFFLTSLCCTFINSSSFSQTPLDNHNITWTTQSKNSSESMPCGGGDIGLNVWVENGDLLFYMARSGNFDENNTLLKLGRVRIKLLPNPFEGKTFQQQLNLKDGNVTIKASNGKLTSEILFWVDVFRPVIHVEIKNNSPVTSEAIYEAWRYKDRLSSGRSNNENSYKWAPQSNGAPNGRMIVCPFILHK